jgi:AcrR family transcriptional regulator
MEQNQKTGLRVKRTKQQVQKALLELLKKGDINKISIRELCSIAKINRTTFYNHYGSQYDVLDEMAEEYIRNTSMDVMNEIASGRSMSEALKEALKYIQDNLLFSQILLDAGHYDLMSYLLKYMPRFDETIIRNLPADIEVDEKKAIAVFTEYGAVRLIKEWILAGCVKSPQEEAEMILRIAGRQLSQEENWQR